jgi:hypothetical protein
VVVIHYFYDNIDVDRQRGFEAAARHWMEKTCVRFVPSTATPRIRVMAEKKDSCSAFVGFPGPDGTLDMNLGWCNSVSHVGNIIHELGHALGMNHEQSRPDAALPINVPAGNGQVRRQNNHLTVNWANIDAAWRPQWTGQARSYIGSQTAGYADYDYGSIMHYPLGDDAATTNPAFQSVPGQRTGLSDGDVRQFEDMYGCAPAPTPGPAPTGCEDYANPWGQSCATWLARGDCATSQGIRDYCKVTCQQCSPSGTSSACIDTRGQLEYQSTCVARALAGQCSSERIQQDCPGSCAEVDRRVSGQTCMFWKQGGHCPLDSGSASGGLTTGCPHLCGHCA